MAKTTSIGVDIGYNQLKVVQLKKTSNGIKIDKFYVEDYGLSSKELESSESRMTVISQILGRIFKDLKPVNVILTISKYEENIRTLSMPIMTEKQLREALKLGGNQDFIPFDLKEMIWDVSISHLYRRKEDIKTDGREKMDVIFAIAKKQIVNDYLDMAEKLKFSVDFLESNALAGLNFSCFNMIIPKEKIWGKIDFGSETTAVNVLEGESLKFGLNVPWGINDIIEVVQSTLSLDWLTAKEYAAKIDFSAGSADGDEQTRKVFIALESKMKDFLRQLNGAFSFFESKSGGKPVSEVILSGGGAKLVNISKYISLKTGKDVKCESGINKNVVSYDKAIEVSLLEALPLLVTAIGAGLRNLLPVKNNINLLPLEIIIGRKLRSRRSLIIVVAACIFLILMLVTGYKMKQRADVMSKISDINVKLDSMSSNVKDLKRKKKAIDKLKALKNRYTKPETDFKKWSEYVYELSSIMPDKMWLETAEWNAIGFEATGACKEDIVKQLCDNGENTANYKKLKITNTRQLEDRTSFKVSIRAEKKPTVRSRLATPERGVK
ncbi:MAG: pilus assembly protein PilM [Candidatus Firestonebacteria bacterium]